MKLSQSSRLARTRVFPSLAPEKVRLKSIRNLGFLLWALETPCQPGLAALSRMVLHGPTAEQEGRQEAAGHCGGRARCVGVGMWVIEEVEQRKPQLIADTTGKESITLGSRVPRWEGSSLPSSQGR